MVGVKDAERTAAKRIAEPRLPTAAAEREADGRLVLPFGTRARFADRWCGRLAAISMDPLRRTVIALEFTSLLVRTPRRVLIEAVVGAAPGSIQLDEAPAIAVGDRAGVRVVANHGVVWGGEERVDATVRGVIIDRPRRSLVALIVSRWWGPRFRLPADQVTELGSRALRVQPHTPPLGRLQRYRADEDIRAEAVAAIRAERTLLARDAGAVQVSVRDGVVRIRGNVRTWLMHRGVIEAVKRVPGILAARDELVEDRGLEIAAASALASDPRTRALNLSVSAHLGEVQVAGRVPGQELAALAIAVVSAVPGVRSARSALVWPVGEPHPWG